MALLNELIDFGKLAKQVVNRVDPNDAKYLEDSAKLFKKAKAISAAANKYTVVYPVLVSTRISDFKAAYAITKQIELECARFIILAAGLQPLIGDSAKNAEINNKINEIFTSSESLKNLHLEISNATNDDFYSCEHYIKNYEELSGKKLYNESRFIKSSEMVDGSMDGENVDDKDKGNNKEDRNIQLTDEEKQFGRQVLGIDVDNLDRTADYQNYAKKIRDTYYENQVKNSTLNPKESRWNTDTLDKTLNDLSKEGPTIVRLKFILSKENTTIEIPLAVKAVLKYVDSSDCCDLIKRSKTFSSRFTTLIKLISGELCFKDWLFQFDEAKKDVEREQQLGHVPWYRNLLAGKNKYRTKNVLEVFKVTQDFVKGKSKDDMPMCTVIFHAGEIEDITSCPLSKFLYKKDQFAKLIDEYMLLGAGIVDDVNNVLYLLFAGESDFRTIDITKAGSKSGSQDVTSKLVTMLGQTVSTLNRR